MSRAICSYWGPVSGGAHSFRLALPRTTLDRWYFAAQPGGVLKEPDLSAARLVGYPRIYLADESCEGTPCRQQQRDLDSTGVRGSGLYAGLLSACGGASRRRVADHVHREGPRADTQRRRACDRGTRRGTADSRRSRSRRFSKLIGARLPRWV